MLPQTNEFSAALPSMEVTGFELTPDLLQKSNRGRNVLLTAVLVGGGVAAGLALWLSSGTSSSRVGIEPSRGALSGPSDSPQPPARKAPLEIESFRVSVATDPDSATVELDGTVVGSGSIERKMLVDHVPHTLRVSADGFESRTVEFTDSPPPNRIVLARQATPPPVAVETPSAAPASEPPRSTRRRRSRSSRATSSGSGRTSEGNQTAQPDSDAPRGLNPNGAPIID